MQRNPSITRKIVIIAWLALIVGLSQLIIPITKSHDHEQKRRSHTSLDSQNRTLPFDWIYDFHGYL